MVFSNFFYLGRYNLFILLQICCLVKNHQNKSDTSNCKKSLIIISSPHQFETTDGGGGSLVGYLYILLYTSNSRDNMFSYNTFYAQKLYVKVIRSINTENNTFAANGGDI